ncbi:quaternary ammonium compound efflux SMR transporter SugE [Pseudaminobacter arsenicus]|uniref:Guanidinium exporter n=1 Tax=Borborobacter arsenicus TaxID=1851146 RepID=A0A432V8I5_9HYPH|nr:quaternary ammonium compound efflux SMR transporter SugE [Pseudaminobacter arsenicus]RUM98464.1 quaternary ammonium compound efflux SMR transporter SugE [Pseudaminobacter arsenicus]
MAWIYLFFAGLFEVVWASTMKQSEGFTKLTPTIITMVAMFISFGLLALAMRTLPLGSAYAIWTGIGAVGAFIVGLVFFSEPATIFRIVSVCLIVAGLTGLKLSSGH